MRCSRIPPDFSRPDPSIPLLKPYASHSSREPSNASVDSISVHPSPFAMFFFATKSNSQFSTCQRLLNLDSSLYFGRCTSRTSALIEFERDRRKVGTSKRIGSIRVESSRFRSNVETFYLDTLNCLSTYFRRLNDVEQCPLSSSRSQEIGYEFESKGSISGLAQFHQALGFAPLVDVRPPLCRLFRRRAMYHSEKSECFVKVLDRWRCIQKYGATSCRYFPTFPADLVGTVLLILLLLASCRSPLENCEKTVENREFLTCFAHFCPFLPISVSFFVSF